jgi:DNA repair protein RadA/Sms
MEQLDQLLGGKEETGWGFACPSVVMLVGEPGIGKSTLILEVMDHVGSKGVYVTAEERIEFIADRAQRLNLKNLDNIKLMFESDPDRVKKAIIASGARLAIIDSLSALGNEPEVDENGKVKINFNSLQEEAAIALDFVSFANKTKNHSMREGKPLTILFMCHVNKESDPAGMKKIEHMGDCMLILEALTEREKPERVIRSPKNRFGDTRFKAHFLMTETGMHEYIPSEEEEPTKKKRRR